MRENLGSDEGSFSQEYFVYCKKKARNQSTISGAPIKADALMGRGGTAKGASFRHACRKRDDPKLVPTTGRCRRRFDQRLLSIRAQKYRSKAAPVHGCLCGTHHIERTLQTARQSPGSHAPRVSRPYSVIRQIPRKQTSKTLLSGLLGRPFLLCTVAPELPDVNLFFPAWLHCAFRSCIIRLTIV